MGLTNSVEWTVRELGNHMTRGNPNYIRLAEGGTRAEFLRWSFNLAPLRAGAEGSLSLLAICMVARC
jgi:hypothetical protein